MALRVGCRGNLPFSTDLESQQFLIVVAWSNEAVPRRSMELSEARSRRRLLIETKICRGYHFDIDRSLGTDS